MFLFCKSYPKYASKKPLRLFSKVLIWGSIIFVVGNPPIDIMEPIFV